MTDRELLELAAKAIGLHVVGPTYEDCEGALVSSAPAIEDKFRWWWNPLVQDGDALRLAVSLMLHARQFPVIDDPVDDSIGMIEIWRTDDDDPLYVEYLRRDDDRLTATRRAIVRAAAAIGKAMP